MEQHVVVAVEVSCVDDVSVDAVSPCVVELAAGLAEDAVDAPGDDGVVVVEGPVVVHENGDHGCLLGMLIDIFGGELMRVENTSLSVYP